MSFNVTEWLERRKQLEEELKAQGAEAVQEIDAKIEQLKQRDVELANERASVRAELGKLQQTQREIKRQVEPTQPRTRTNMDALVLAVVPTDQQADFDHIYDEVKKQNPKAGRKQTQERLDKLLANAKIKMDLDGESKCWYWKEPEAPKEETNASEF